MRVLVWVLLAGLVLAHQWDPVNGDRTLVDGFLPMPLVYHALLSIAAAFVWYLVTVFAWPAEVVEETVDSATSGEPAP